MNACPHCNQAIPLRDWWGKRGPWQCTGCGLVSYRPHRFGNFLAITIGILLFCLAPIARPMLGRSTELVGCSVFLLVYFTWWLFLSKNRKVIDA